MPHTAIILAGGFGTRLQTVINDVPKPMAPLNGEPFLNYQLRYLKHYDFKKIILSVGYLSDKIRNYYQNNFNGLEINYAEEHSALGTGGGIRLAMEQCEEEIALVLNGDSFFDVNLADFCDLHKKHGAQFSIALRQIEDAGRYGTIVIDSEQAVTSFLEKNNNTGPGTINGGVYLLDKRTFMDSTASNKNFSIEKDFFEKQLDNFIIRGFEFSGYFIDIGIPPDYNKAQNDFKGFKYK